MSIKNNILKLENNEIKTIHASRTSYQSNLAVFEICKIFFERNNETKTKIVRSALLDEINEVLEKDDASVKNRLKKVAITASKFLGYKLSHKDLFYNRIEDITNLLEYISNQQNSSSQNLGSTTFQDVRSQIQLHLKIKDNSKKVFNENISALIIKLKDQYHIKYASDYTEFEELTKSIMELSEEDWKILVKKRAMRDK